MSIAVSSPQLPTVVGEVLADFRREHGHDAWLWVRGEDGWTIGAGTAPAPGDQPGPDAAEVPASGGAVCVEVGGADSLAAARFLATVLVRFLRHEEETRFFGRELAERYEEITLLYSISEILGSVISLEEAAAVILSEVTDTLRVERATLWLYNPESDALELIAAVGAPRETRPVPVSDPGSVTATVFRERRSVILEPGDEFPRAFTREDGERGSFLSVPVSYTPPEGESRTIGVINLAGRPRGERFSAGDQKLISAIASQIGAAVENSRLVAESLRQERMVRELELAHDLQLKLLPSVEQFHGFAQVAARCEAAESVGGDFYHLFRLPGRRLGVVIGDVSSHGFGAALIMALTMSAVAIHASEGDSPAEVLHRAHRALIDELETTEMYLTLFYGVIDPEEGKLTYASAGHSHAFRVDGAGEARRLGATAPPLGIVDFDAYSEETVPWCADRDLLFLFTDGLSDSLGLGEIAGVRALLDEIARDRDAPVETLLDRLFTMLGRDPDFPPDDRTAVLVRI